MNEIYPPTTPATANIKYPKAVQSLIDQLKIAELEFAEQDTTLAGLKDDLLAAKQADMMALKAAAIASEPDPGTVETQAVERSILYQYEKTLHARSMAQKAGSLVAQALKDHRVAVLDECIREAKEGITQWQQAIMKIQTDYMSAADLRNKSLEGIRMVSNIGLTRDLVQFDNNFPISGLFEVPKTHEPRILELITLLDGLFHPAHPELPRALHAKLAEYKAAAE